MSDYSRELQMPANYGVQRVFAKGAPERSFKRAPIIGTQDSCAVGISSRTITKLGAVSDLAVLGPGAYLVWSRNEDVSGNLTRVSRDAAGSYRVGEFLITVEGNGPSRDALSVARREAGSGAVE